MSFQDRKAIAFVIPASNGVYDTTSGPDGNGDYVLGLDVQPSTFAELLGLTVNIETTVASAAVEVWLLRVGADPAGANSTSWFLAKSIDGGTLGMTSISLSSWAGVKLRGKSGGTSGTLHVSVTAD